MRLNKNIKIFLNYFLGPLLFVWLSFSIYDQVKHQPDLKNSWIRIKGSLQSTEIWDLIVVIVLMIVNWSIEALKWRISIRHIQTVSFFKSFRAILSGVSFSVNTPNRVGEYLGRVLYLEEGNRLKAASLTIVSSISQLIVTLGAGFVGLAWLKKNIVAGAAGYGFDPSIWLLVLEYGTILSGFILTLFYFRLSLFVRIISRLAEKGRYTWLISSLQDIDGGLLVQLFCLSVLRYLVFVIQYFLLFRLFGVSIAWWQCAGVISVVFLVLAIIPTFAIAELGLRGKVSLKLVALFSANSLGISLATVSIWFINLILPAIAGSLLIVSIKIFKNRNERN